jgi:hypothetical protein
MTQQPDASSATQDGALLSSLSVVEAQPLEDRAQGYTAVYEELRQRLESDGSAQ